jgi:hypothetical protein
MQAIEFQTTVKKIVSAMPKEKQGELSAYAEDEMVRVIVHTPVYQQPHPRKDLLQDAKDKGYEDFFDYLLDHPIRIPNVKYLTREEAHER